MTRRILGAITILRWQRHVRSIDIAENNLTAAPWRGQCQFFGLIWSRMCINKNTSSSSVFLCDQFTDSLSRCLGKGRVFALSSEAIPWKCLLAEIARQDWTPPTQESERIRKSQKAWGGNASQINNNGPPSDRKRNREEQIKFIPWLVLVLWNVSTPK